MSQWVKKVIAILIALIFVITSIQFSFGAEKFKDMSTHWSKDYVNEMVSKGILSGYPDGTFKPEEAVSRIQAVVMISRMFDQSQVDAIYSANKAKYESDFKKYSIPTWAQKSFVFCIEKGIFQQSLLEYLIENGKESVAKRWEIPIYIGKALGYGESSKVYVLDFEDVDDIPASALPYVGLLVEEKIISGQTEYPSNKVKFNPYGVVKRGEMAKILKLSSEIISGDSSPSDNAVMSIEGEVYSISNLSGQTVLILETSNGTKLSFKNGTSSISVKLGGKSANVSDISKGDDVKIQVSGDQLISVEIEDRDEVVEGYFVKTYFKLGADGLNKTFIQVEVDKQARDFEIDGKSSIEIDGKSASVYDLEKDDKVEIEAANGVVENLEAFSKSGNIKGYIKEVNESKGYMVITDKDDDDKHYKFEIDDDADVERNGDSSKLSELRVGDEVEVELEYSIIVEIDAESVSKSVEGILKEIIISNEPKITIMDEDDKLVTYRLSPDFKVEIGGEGAGLYDLRLNYEVELKLETDLVTEIECDDKVAVTTITGEIEDVNTRENIIRIKDSRTKNSVYVRYTTSTTMENYDGKSMDEDDFDDEDIISVIGEDNLGSISADRIIKIQ